MAILLGIPVLGGMLMLQMGIVSRLTLLEGAADLVMLVVIAWALQENVKTAWQWAIIGGGLVSLVTATPFFAPLIGYLIATGVARLFQQRVWQSPILAMLLTTFVGTILYHLVSIAMIQAAGTSLSVLDSLTLVTLPSALLNLILALPVFIVIRDLAYLVYPSEEA